MDLLSFYNLQRNPFSLEIDISTFVNYKKEREKLINAIRSAEKIILLTGPTGVGKTTLLLWIYKKIKDPNMIYLPKPPRTISELSKDIINTLPIIERFLVKKDIFTLLNKRNFKIIIDEATFISDDMLEWIKVLSDQTKSQFILSGLPELEERIINKHRTFYERILTKVQLKRLDEDSAKKLILTRLKKAGNDRIFTPEAIDYLVRISGGFPRNLLKNAYKALLLGFEKRENPISLNTIMKIKKLDIQRDMELSDRQEFILRLLANREGLTLREIHKYIKDKYDISLNALAVMLKRMVENKYLIREKTKKGYVYFVSDALKNTFIKESKEL